MNKKEKLISSLRLAIEALKNDTIFYKWHDQQSCNCGIVSQAILGKSADEIASAFKPVIDKITEMNNGRTKDKIPFTWKEGVKHLCPLTGKSIVTIFNDLFEAGLSKSDIVHLEYMDNEAILLKSGIKTTKRESTSVTIPKGVNKRVVSKTVFIKHPNWFKALFGMKIATTEDEIVEDIVYETKTEIKDVRIDYYTHKENLILYLQAWVDILLKGSLYNQADFKDLDTHELESELLNAVADENYEQAARLRDAINASLIKK